MSDKLTVKITPRILDPSCFSLETEITDSINEFTSRFYTRVLELEDQAVRDCLIALGWTPPKEDK